MSCLKHAFALFFLLNPFPRGTVCHHHAWPCNGQHASLATNHPSTEALQKPHRKRIASAVHKTIVSRGNGSIFVSNSTQPTLYRVILEKQIANATRNPKPLLPTQHKPNVSPNTPRTLNHYCQRSMILMSHLTPQEP